MQHPSIVEVGTIGVPHPIYGEEVVSYIVFGSGVKISEAEIIDFCMSKLPKAKIPKAVYKLNELPKNSRGKLDRSALASHYQINFSKTAAW